MIVLDNQRLDLNNPKEPVEKAVYNKIQWYRDNIKVFTIKDETKITTNDKGRPHMPPEVSFRLDTSVAKSFKYTNENGVEEEYYGRWMQCDKPPRPTAEGIYMYEATHLRVMKNQSFKPDIMAQAEKIFMFNEVYKPDMVGLSIQDLDQEAKDRNAIRRARSHAEYLITGDELDEQTLRRLAYSINISNEGMNLDILKDEMISRLGQMQKSKIGTGYGYDEFIRDARNAGEEVAVKAYIQRGIEKRLITANKEKSSWVYMNGDVIAQVPPNKWNRRVDVLMNKFMSDGAAYDLFLETIGEGASDIASTTDDFDKMTNEDLDKYAWDNFEKRWPNPKTNPDLKRSWLREKVEKISQ